MTVHVFNEKPENGLDCIVPLEKSSDNTSVFQKSTNLSEAQRTRILADFKAEQGEVYIHYLPDGGRLFLLGLGESPNFAGVLKSFKIFSFKHKQKFLNHIVVNFGGYDNQKGEKELLEWAEAAVNGLTLGTYEIGKYKTTSLSSHPLDGESKLSIHLPFNVELHEIERGYIIGDCQKRIMDLVNAPSNVKQTRLLADWAVESAKEYGYEVSVWDKERIVKEGFHALLAVNRGSEWPAYFVLMHHKPKDLPENAPRIGILGKGVTFDTGGVSLKASTNLHYMKSDMGGGAAVLGTMEAVVRLKLPVELIAAVPITDNAIGERAIRPSDVIQSFSGKSIEITDTDAEGRLILADALNYVKRKYSPDILIDLATLTGSSVRTFGYECGALFSNDDTLANELMKAGELTGERVWRLPIWSEYMEDMKSDVADVKNFSGKPIAGAITAAKFLEFFIDNHPRWAHMDIAGVAFGQSDLSQQKSATGFGVRLLVQFFENLLENSPKA